MDKKAWSVVWRYPEGGRRYLGRYTRLAGETRDDLANRFWIEEGTLVESAVLVD